MVAKMLSAQVFCLVLFEKPLSMLSDLSVFDFSENQNDWNKTAKSITGKNSIF
jgi:hypothetical protein